MTQRPTITLDASTARVRRGAPRFRPGATRPASPRAAWTPDLRTARDLVGEGLPAGVSLDVYDTVLVRACGAPTALYLWLGRRLATSGVTSVSPEVFARIRHRAELAVWHREGGLDSHVSLRDLHVEVARRLGEGPEVVERLVRAELELERQVVRPVPGAAELVTTVLESGRTVVFASDTYLDAGEVRAQLVAAGVSPGGCRVLTSSDLGSSKATGTLFEELSRTTGLAARDLVHLGDNPHSDVDVPDHLGVRARWVPAGRLNRHEATLHDARYTTGGLSASLAGASRVARLSVAAHDDHRTALRDVAAGVAAPVLIGYVLWLLDRARKLGLDRLVFLARDGQVLAELARQLAPRVGVEVEIRYLMVSRRSTNLAATFTLAAEETAWIFRDTPHLSGEEMLERFGISAVDIDAHLPEPRLDLAGPGSARRLGEVLRPLLAAGPVRELVLDRAAARRELVTAYLEQEGLLDDRATAIVDFGGVGSQVRALHTLVRGAGVAPPRILLVGLDLQRNASPAARGDDGAAWLRDTETYLYDHRRRLGIRRARGFGTCLQMFTAADHGTVTGYERVGGQVVPVLATEHDEAVRRWGLEVVRRTLATVADASVLDADLVDPRGDLRDVSCELIDRFWRQPTRAEAAAWGSFPFEGAQATDAEPRPLAAPYTVRRIGREVADRRFPDLGWQHWHEASVALSAPPVRRSLEVAERTYRWLESREGPGLATTTRSLVRHLVGRR